MYKSLSNKNDHHQHKAKNHHFLKYNLIIVNELQTNMKKVMSITTKFNNPYFSL
jgi:hypothetical protein